MGMGIAMATDDVLKPIEPYIGQIVGYVERERPVCVVAGSWYAVCLEPHEGKLAKEEISKHGLIPYLPMAPIRERHGRGMERTVWRPMFGPYLFVKCDPTPQHWRLIMSARGVHRMLGLGGSPLSIGDSEMEVIRLCEAEYAEGETQREVQEEAARIAKAGGRSGIVWHFSAGEKVKIKNGPFAAFYADLETAVDPHDRIKALVSLFGRQSSVELSAFDIEAL